MAALYASQRAPGAVYGPMGADAPDVIVDAAILGTITGTVDGNASVPAAAGSEYRRFASPFATLRQASSAITRAVTLASAIDLE